MDGGQAALADVGLGERLQDKVPEAERECYGEVLGQFRAGNPHADSAATRPRESEVDQSRVVNRRPC
jgi:hypothetical protein